MCCGAGGLRWGEGMGSCPHAMHYRAPALCTAVRSRRPVLQIVRMLLRAGASVSVRDDCGETALHVAVRAVNAPTARALVRAGAGAPSFTPPLGNSVPRITASPPPHTHKRTHTNVHTRTVVGPNGTCSREFGLSDPAASNDQGDTPRSLALVARAEAREASADGAAGGGLGNSSRELDVTGSQRNEPQAWGWLGRLNPYSKQVVDAEDTELVCRALQLPMDGV